MFDLETRWAKPPAPSPLTGEGRGGGEQPPHPSEKRHFRGAVERARMLRREMTEAERRLWHGLRAQRLGFRRQAPINRYIVDFVSHAARLVVELDGSQHLDAKPYDEARTRFLKSRGYSVLRFGNGEVFDNPEGVIETILYAIPDPSPLEGEGS